MKVVDLGFPGGVGVRMIAVAVFALFALVAVLVVERGGNPAPITGAVPVATTASGVLELETTFPVGRWTIVAGSEVIAGLSSDTRHWQAKVQGNPGSIFVQADSEDPTSATPVALRWRFAGKSGILWGEGTVAGTLAGTLATERTGATEERAR